MASERKTGLVMPGSLLRPTSQTPPDQLEATDSGPEESLEAPEGTESASAETRTPRARTRRKKPGGETRGRKLVLPDTVHDRLWLLARQRRQSVSSVAAEILDRGLPRFRVEREG
jgi:hypothetical protein